MWMVRSPSSRLFTPIWAPEQIRDSPKLLVGNVQQIAAQIVDRVQTLGLTYHALRGAEPED